MAIREINLIPDDILMKRYLLRHLSIWTGLLAGSMLLIFIFHRYHEGIAMARNLPDMTIEEADKHLESRIAEINEVRNALETLDRRQSLMEDIFRDSLYSEILFRLVDTMNRNTWLSKLTINGGDKNHEGYTVLNFTGYSTKNEELGNFIERLSNESLFKEVSLKYARETTLTRDNPENGLSSSLVHFQIECTVQG